VIAPAIAASSATVADVEKASGLHRNELQSYLNGSDIEVRSLVAAGGLLGLSPTDLFKGANA